MTRRLFFISVAFAFAPGTTANSADAQKLVAIGHSSPAGTYAANLFAESQEWAYPALVAQSVGAEYSTPSLVGTGSEFWLMALGFTAMPHWGTLEPAPYPGPPPYPTTGQADWCAPHTNLAVPSATLHDMLHETQFPLDPTSEIFGCRGSCGGHPGCTIFCQLTTVFWFDTPLGYHTLLNGFPYLFPFGVSPSGDVFTCPEMPFALIPRTQVEIAALLEPDWIIVDDWLE